MAALVSIVIVVALVAVFLLTNSSSVEPGKVASEPLVYDDEQTGTLLVSLGSEQTGINFRNELARSNQIKYTYNGAGVAAGDYDGDGLVDVYLVSEESTSRLYHNLGDMRFEDVTEKSGLANTTGPGGFSVGAYFADIDNDGDLDLFITNWKVPNRLYRNDGDGTFTDITEESGVGYAGGSTTATFADYDRDGDLDFFLATYRPNPLEFEPEKLETVQLIDGQLVLPPEMQDRLLVLETGVGTGTIVQLGERDLLYRNRGDGSFEEVAQEAGITGAFWGLSAIFADVDNDNWVDLYITNDFWTPDGYYHNEGDGTFTAIETAMVQHTPWFSMGVDFADINNDGLIDYFVGDMMSRDRVQRLTQHGQMDMGPTPQGSTPQLMRNGLFLNNGDGSFSDIAWLGGVAASAWTWTAKFADMDLDGYVDLLITNGMVNDLMDSDSEAQAELVGATQGREAAEAFRRNFPPLNDPDMAFRNNGDLTFTEVSAAWGFNKEAVSHGAAFADFDGDGDLDVIVNYLNDQAGVYRNDATLRRISVRLRGIDSNSQGIGARITLTTDIGTQTRYMTTSGGYLSSHEAIVVFGLGSAVEIMELRVAWPSGQIQSIPGQGSVRLTPDTQYTLTEPDNEVEPNQAFQMKAQFPQFEEVSASAGLRRRHIEGGFDDFAVQPLLPRRLSTLGPGLAWADVDGDGHDDLYVAGPAGQSGTLYHNNGDGSFTDRTEESIAWEPAFEELAPLWWNSGQGNNSELLLSYSGVESREATIRISSRFYSDSDTPFGLKRGGWDAFSQASGGPLAAADFDGDGDLDLFVGGRVLPGRWPLAASSRLYENREGSLIDVTAELAPDLVDLGLATGAIWTDVDNDGAIDLVVATEWGPVHVFANEGGRLTENTAEAGLEAWTGLWTGIVAGDFDSDGDMDLAVANLGLNTRYQASPSQPAVLYAGDVDGNGSLDLIEAHYVGGTLYPLRARGAVGATMPFILEDFDSFLGYAEATLDEIYGPRLNSAERFEAATLAHSLFINDGKGRFEIQPLPKMAQVTAAYGIVVADLDNDGIDDLYLVGNFRGADHETMAYDGGTGYWLRGQGDGSFTVLPASQSGLFVPDEARGLAVSDYDGDGWVDIAVGINNGTPLLFDNQGVAGNSFLRVRLDGPDANPTGVGARISVARPDGSTVTREVYAGSGYLSQDSATLIFGLGQAATARITVRWPDGATTTLTDVQAGETVIVSR